MIHLKDYSLFESTDDKKYLDKNGKEIKKGALVDLPEPNDTDNYQHEFSGNVDSFRNGNIVVIDGDGEAIEIEPERVTVTE